MRNVVTHLTRNQPGTFSVYEWAEAGLLARFWLCLSLLNTVGYCGQIAEIMQSQPHWTGWMRQVPWHDYVLLTEAGGLREGLRLVPRGGRESPEQVPGLPPVPHEAGAL